MTGPMGARCAHRRCAAPAAAGREFRFDHRGERHADQKLELIARGLEKRIDPDVSWNVVSRGAEGECRDEHGKKGCRPTPHRFVKLTMTHDSALHRGGTLAHVMAT
jgi:hypothetical protein